MSGSKRSGVGAIGPSAGTKAACTSTGLAGQIVRRRDVGSRAVAGGGGEVAVCRGLSRRDVRSDRRRAGRYEPGDVDLDRGIGSDRATAVETCVDCSHRIDRHERARLAHRPGEPCGIAQSHPECEVCRELMGEQTGAFAVPGGREVGVVAPSPTGALEHGRPVPGEEVAALCRELRQREVPRVGLVLISRMSCDHRPPDSMARPDLVDDEENRIASAFEIAVAVAGVVRADVDEHVGRIPALAPPPPKPVCRSPLPARGEQSGVVADAGAGANRPPSHAAEPLGQRRFRHDGCLEHRVADHGDGAVDPRGGIECLVRERSLDGRRWGDDHHPGGDHDARNDGCEKTTAERDRRAHIADVIDAPTLRLP